MKIREKILSALGGLDGGTALKRIPCMVNAVGSGHKGQQDSIDQMIQILLRDGAAHR